MTPFDRLIEYLTRTWQFDIYILFKLGVLLFLFLYILFTLVVVRQIQVMSETITGVLEKELTIAAKLLVGLGIASLMLGVFVL